MNSAPPQDPSLRREVDARVGRTLCQRYTLEGVLGVGATGAVYRASHRNGNRVAIKVFHPSRAASKEMRERALRDAYVANKIEHAGAVRINDDDTTEDGLVFVVMDLLEGETLEAMLDRHGGRLPANELVPLAQQLLEVLAAAHAKGVLHRGVSPSKLFVSPSRTVRVLGFGTAIAVPSCIAPEQARGETALVDAQTDVWQAGAVMFRALAGRPVYQAATPEMVKVQAATQPPSPLLSVVASAPSDLAEIVDRALAWKKDDRWKTPQAMATALTSVRLPGTIPPPAPTLGSASSPPPPASPFASSPPPVNPFASPPQASAPPPVNPFASPPQAGRTQASPAAQASPAQASPPQTVLAAPLPYGPPPGFALPQASTDNGWIKWAVGAAAVMALLLLVGGGAALVLLRRTSPSSHSSKVTASGAWSDAESPVPVTSKDPVWGNRDALVTVVMFSDFQCPFCGRVEPTIEQVKSNYGPESVRVVWKNEPLPFHPNAKPAAEAAQVVFALGGSDAFFKFHDLAFKNQAQLGPDNYRLWAISSGVDGKAYDRMLATHAALAKIDEDHALAQKVEANGTPSFRINGIPLSGAQPIDKFKSIIDAELVKAASKVTNGTPKNKLYVVLSTENFTLKAQPATTAKADDPTADSTTVWRVPVDGSPVRGPLDAPITIVEFADFQCPFCKRAEASIDKVRDTYGDKVRIVWKNEPLPFHPRAEPSAELALEARAAKGDLAFWRAHDHLFDAQPSLDDDALLKIGLQLGLDGNRVRKAIADKTHRAEIDADLALADDIQATGTPNFFINGRRLVGAQPFERFKSIIDEELTKFDTRDPSISPREYYANLIRTAKGPPEPEKKKAPPVPAGAPFRGGKNARVVIQEWADFQCPFCLRVEPTLRELLTTYGDKVKIVWRDKPLSIHPDAALAAEVAREALEQKGMNGFWDMHDVLFGNQQHLKRDDLEAYAGNQGLDAKRLGRAMDGLTHKAVIDADDKLGADIGITGTPAFLINDYYLSGAQPAAKFKKLIDKALNEAR